MPTALKINTLLKQTLILPLLLLSAVSVNASTVTLSADPQIQTTDGQNFNFIFVPTNYEAGTTSTLTLTVQGDFDETANPATAVGVEIGGGHLGRFDRLSSNASGQSNPGFSNLNTYKYSLDFTLDATETANFMNDSTVAVDFSNDVIAICGWFNYSNCLVDVGDAPFAQVDFTYNIPEVPIPAALWLFGSALLGLGGIARRKKA